MRDTNIVGHVKKIKREINQIKIKGGGGVVAIRICQKKGHFLSEKKEEKKSYRRSY